MAVTTPDPLTKIRTFLAEKPAEVQSKVDAWTAKQPVWVEGMVAGIKGSGQGLFLGLVMGAVGKMGSDTATAGGAAMPPGMLSMGGPLVQARNFMVMTGVNAGVLAVAKRLRGGRDDVNNQIISGFCSGASYSLVSGGMGSRAAVMPGATPPNPLMAAFTAGVVFALFQGGFYKAGEMWGGGPKVADTEYVRVKAMLNALNMGQFEKNVRKGQLTDATIGLWDTAALQEVKIPAGPRLVILDHIETYRHILRPAMPIPKNLPHA
ncbi:Chloroplastic import inner membrane translocase subunit HP30-2 [Chlorella vulgaris]